MINTNEIRGILMDHLYLEVRDRSNDPEDDGRVLALLWCDETIAEVTL